MAIQKLCDQWTILQTSVALNQQFFSEIKASLTKTGSDNWWFRPPGFLQKTSHNHQDPTTDSLCASWHKKYTFCEKGSANVSIRFHSVLSCSLLCCLEENDTGHFSQTVIRLRISGVMYQPFAFGNRSSTVWITLVINVVLSQFNTGLCLKNCNKIFL